MFCSFANAQQDTTKWSSEPMYKYWNHEMLYEYYTPERLSENDRQTTLKLYGRLPDVPEIGDDMADDDMLDTEGNTRRIADYLGKYLLLKFYNNRCWATTVALPEIKEISEIYSDKLTIISVSRDDDATWKETMATRDMPWVHLHDPHAYPAWELFLATHAIPLNLREPKNIGGLSAAYSVIGSPTFVLISPEGKIVDKWWGYSEGTLKKVMSENIE